MANAKIQPFTSLDQSKYHCYTQSTTCTLFKLANEVGPRTKYANRLDLDEVTQLDLRCLHI